MKCHVESNLNRTRFWLYAGNHAESEEEIKKTVRISALATQIYPESRFRIWRGLGWVLFAESSPLQLAGQGMVTYRSSGGTAARLPLRLLADLRRGHERRDELHRRRQRILRAARGRPACAHAHLRLGRGRPAWRNIMATYALLLKVRQRNQYLRFLRRRWYFLKVLSFL